MSMTPPPGTDRTLGQRWTAFWFAPRDPTTLGFMRVMTGLLILYIHLAYSLDLQGFFGRYAWFNAAAVTRERQELPWNPAPFWDWDETQAMARLPEFPHRRQAVLDFVKKVGDLPPADRAHALRYLTRAVASDSPAETFAHLRYVQLLGSTDQTWRDRKAQLLADTPPDAAADYAPPTLRAQPKEVREQVAGEIESLLAVLPKDGNTPDREYILMHLMERDQPHRRALVEFIVTLPADPAERARLVDYLAYWDSDPRKVWRTGNGVFSVWFHVTDPTHMALIHGGILVVMALFTVGFCTRVTSVLTWGAAMCYIHRSQQVLFGMDTMMGILLFYLMIGNSGAALSVDRLIARYRAARASLARSGGVDPPTRAFLAAPPPSVSAGLAIRLVQVHFCFIYMAAGLSKLQGPGWWNGNAFWDVMANPEFTLIRYQWYETALRAYVGVKPLYYTTIALGVWFTLALEIAFPFLVWTRWRPVMVWMAILLHAGIGILMGLNLFELLMMIMLLAYMPSAPIRERLGGGPGLPRLAVAAPATAGTAAVVAADVDGQVALTPQPAGPPTVTAPGGKPVTGGEAVDALFAHLRLLRVVRPVLWVPGVKGLLARKLFPAAGAAAPGPQTPAAAS